MCMIVSATLPEHTPGLHLNESEVSVVLSLKSGYYLTTNSVTRVLKGLWLNDEVL